MSVENKPIIEIQNGAIPDDEQRQVYPGHAENVLYNLYQNMEAGSYNIESATEKMLHQSIKDLLANNGQTK